MDLVSILTNQGVFGLVAAIFLWLYLGARKETKEANAETLRRDDENDKRLEETSRELHETTTQLERVIELLAALVKGKR